MQYAAERRQEIVRTARRDGRVDVGVLAALFEVTTETVRRDLLALERQGLIRRVHGGALPIERLGFEPDVWERTRHMAAEKKRIAAAALDEVPGEGAILLDAGTTTGALADMLPDDRPLTVVTNALPLAQVLVSRPNCTLLLLGGRIRGRTLAAVDAWAVQTLADLSVDVGFIATNGVSVQRGLTTPDIGEAAVKRAMIEASRRVVLLADHTKVGNDQFARFGELSQVDLYITDDGLDPATVKDLQAAGPQVVRAGMGGAGGAAAGGLKR